MLLLISIGHEENLTVEMFASLHVFFLFCLLKAMLVCSTLARSMQVYLPLCLAPTKVYQMLRITSRLGFKSVPSWQKEQLRLELLRTRDGLQRLQI